MNDTTDIKTMLAMFFLGTALLIAFATSSLLYKIDTQTQKLEQVCSEK